MPAPSFSYSLAGASTGAASPALAPANALPVGRDLLLDSSGDLSVTGGDLSLVSGAPAVKQEVQIRLRTLLGECFLDTTQGVPYLQRILVKSPSLSAIRDVFREEILKTVGIGSIETLTIEQDTATRTLRVDWTARTDGAELVSGTERI